MVPALLAYVPLAGMPAAAQNEQPSNALSRQPLPDYRLLWDRYGMFFVPQDMENLHPLPSGILGPVTLSESTPAPLPK